MNYKEIVHQLLKNDSNTISKSEKEAISITLCMLLGAKEILENILLNKKIIEEIKAMEGAKWHGYDANPRKIWSITDSERNRFQLKYLTGENPYERYDKPLINYESKRALYEHQKEMTAHILTRKQCIIA